MRLYTPPEAKPVPPQAHLVFKGIIYDVYQWEQKMFDGTVKTFEMLKRPDTIRVIAIKENKIVIIKQEQPHNGYFIDLPGGMHDIEDENELDAAKRELLEETGIQCSTWKLIEAKQAQFKIDKIDYLFVAYDADEPVQPQKLDIGEKVEVTQMNIEEVKLLADNPSVRYLPQHILKNVSTIEELKRLPDLLQGLL